MRIRITDRRLIDFGISVGDVFLPFSSNHYGFMIKYKGSCIGMNAGFWYERSIRTVGHRRGFADQQGFEERVPER